MAENLIKVDNWAPIEGSWQKGQDSITYQGTTNTARYSEITAGNERLLSRLQRGIAVSGVRFSNGRVMARINYPSEGEIAHVILGYRSQNSDCITVGLGGFGQSYVIAEFVPGSGLRKLAGAGEASNLQNDLTYSVEVAVNGQRLTLIVDDIRVLDHVLDEPLDFEQLGLLALGNGPSTFEAVKYSKSDPTAFVVMQFGSPYDELYNDVIKPVCSEFNFEAFRADDMYGPGVIIQDIIQGLTESHLVIADVTPANPNVFYELGYSHALNKPTILLADRKAENLPFDIRSYRVIFYDNTIGGKSSLEIDLRRHLRSIVGE